MQGRVPAQKFLDVMRGLSTGEANVGEERDGGNCTCSPNHTDIWGRFSHALAADLDDALPIVIRVRHVLDCKDANKRHLKNSEQCSSVTTQTNSVHEAGSHLKASVRRLSATTQKVLLSLPRTHSENLQNVSRPWLQPRPPGHVKTLVRTQSERHSFGDTLQSMSKPWLQLGPPGHVKTLAQHLDQLKLERQNSCLARTSFCARTSSNCFQHCPVTAVCEADEAVTCTRKEVHQKSFKVAAEAGSTGRKGFSLGPDWPRSRQLILSPPQRDEGVQ